MDLWNVNRTFKAILAAADSPSIRSHDLRHAPATLRLVQGAHPKVVMDILGYSQIAVTFLAQAVST